MKWKLIGCLLVLAAGLLGSATLFAQTLHVRGRVVNADGQPVARASVTVRGSAIGTNSDESGFFEVNASSNATLVISSVGFLTRQIEVAGRTALNDVTLAAGANDLEQVVVIGYGTQRRKDITGAVATVSGTVLREVPSPNLIDQLKGRTAGVDIVSNGATPGSAGQIRIRGNRTLTTSQSSSDALDAPLIVLDGIPYAGSINDISPEDVASLDILKDASATAVFGSRGAGGVILITTKRGRTGRPQVTLDSYQGWQNILGQYKTFSGPEYAQFKQDAATYNRTSPGTTSYPLTAAEQAALAAGISTDWQKLIYTTGFTTSDQVGLSGGNEFTQYGLGVGYYNTHGIIPHQNFERYSMRFNIDHKITSWLKVGVNSITAVERTNTPGGSGVPGNLVKLTPLASPYNPDGSINLFPAAGSIDAAIYVNPLTLLSRASDILAASRTLSTFNTAYAEVQFLPGLRYRFIAGYTYRQTQSDSYNPVNTFVNSATVQTASSAGVGNSESWNYDLQHLLYYDRTIGKHAFGVTGLFEVSKDHSQGSAFTALGVPADYMQNANLGAATGTLSVNPNGTFYNESGLLSYMGRLTYAYDNRYLATVTVREDGASPLSPGHKYFTYPAANVGWIISNERFIQGVTWVSSLKLRGGWGISGNRNVTPYSTLGLLGSGNAYNYNFGPTTATGQSGYIVNTLANSSLGWQSTSQTDIGLDFSLFKNRITGSVDWYDQRTKDILLSVNLPYSNGAGSTFQNLGKTQGRGLEISLSTVNVQTRSGFTWSTDFNFFFNREKIIELTTPAETQQIANGWFVGQPLTVIYDVRKLGIWQTADSGKALATQTSPVQYPGQIRVQDLNGDGKIDANDRQILGNFQPDWSGGITNRFSYKGFDLSIVINARMGQTVLVPYLSADGGSNGFPFFMQGRVNQIKVNYWTRTNATNDFPAPDASSDRTLFSSTLAYRDGSFIRCRSVNLGYTVNSNLLKRASITSLRVYANVTNPFFIYAPLVRDGLAIDPEGNGYGGSVAAYGAGDTGAPTRQVSVNLNNPSTRMFTVGVNVKF